MKKLRNSDWLRAVLLIPNSANLYYHILGGKQEVQLLMNTEYVIFNQMTSYSFQFSFFIFFNFVYCVRLILRL